MQNMSAHEAKSRFGQLLDTARHEPVTIEKHGRAVAVMISKEDYDEIQQIRLQQLRQEVQYGLDAVEKGAYSEFDKDELKKLGERVKQAGRQREKDRNS